MLTGNGRNHTEPFNESLYNLRNKKIIKWLPTLPLFTAYLHQHQDNSFYPFGGEMIFPGRLARYFNETLGREIEAADISKWIDWSTEVSS